MTDDDIEQQGSVRPYTHAGTGWGAVEQVHLAGQAGHAGLMAVLSAATAPIASIPSSIESL